jgi:hypothetical protein
MKIELNKKGMTRYCPPEQLEQFKSAGWLEVNAKPAKIVKADEVITLKAPAKSKGAVEESLDNANQQGDE